MAMLNLNAYGTGRLQDMLALLEQAGEMTAAELRGQVAAHVQQAMPAPKIRSGAARKGRRSTVICSCGGEMDLHQANVSRCTRVGGKWKTQAICRVCGCEEWSELDIVEIRAGRPAGRNR